MTGYIKGYDIKMISKKSKERQFWYFKGKELMECLYTIE